MKRCIILFIAVFSLIAVAGASVAADKKAPAAKPAATDKGAAKPEAAKPAAAKTGPIDINSASKQELMGIPGVGEAYSQKIIAGRPYKNKAQLKTKGQIPADLYAKIQDKVVAKQK